jgi:primosomal protein N' (replication factor Y)
MSKYLESNKLLYIPSNKDEELEFLLRIINDNLNNKLNTLILCSDILQSYEISSKIKKLLKVKVACLNSNVSESLIYDYFHELDKFSVFVTTPAYSLWNYPNLKTIVMLDQESSNYRNDQSPRYDLNLVMLDLVNLYKTINNQDIKLVLHSLAPLLNTYKEAMLGHLKLISNKTDDVIKYEVVNLTTLSKEFKSTIVSPALYMKINEALKKKQKTILILNNKGYSTSVTCRSCGKTLKCLSCHVPLQYHKEKHELYCPVCYRKLQEVKLCPICKNNKLSYDGFGMEKLEEVVLSLFDNAKVKVLKESNFDSLEEIIDNFNQDELDILITSDTFSRSVDIKDLSVVGIINLDVVLNTPSYDANHLAYSMLQHAKKLLNNGTLVIQTYDVKNIVLKNFILNDFDEYFYEELKVRQALKVEPLYEVNRILVKGDFKEVFITANNIKKTILNINPNISVIGPSYNYKEKKVQLIVKHKDPNIKKIYMHIYEMFQKKETMVIFDRYSKSIS